MIIPKMIKDNYYRNITIVKSPEPIKTMRNESITCIKHTSDFNSDILAIIPYYYVMDRFWNFLNILFLTAFWAAFFYYLGDMIITLLRDGIESGGQLFEFIVLLLVFVLLSRYLLKSGQKILKEIRENEKDM